MARIHRKTVHKSINDLYNHRDVITHLEPNNLECEVKKALESITRNKASGGDGILAEFFQTFKNDAVKVVALDRPANLKNTAVATGQEKVSFHSNPKERLCQKSSNYPAVELIPHVSRLMFQILKARLQW